MSNMSIFVLLIVLFNVVWSSKVYVKQSVPVVKCITNPAKDICPAASSKIPDLSSFGAAAHIGNKTFIEQLFSQISALPGVNGSCKSAVKSFYCSWLLPVCDPMSDYMTFFDEETIKVCKDGEMECAGVAVIEAFLNCSRKTEKHPRRMICKEFPSVVDDPYPCETINYKIPEVLTVNTHTMRLVDAHKSLKEEEDKLDKECVEDIANIICKIIAPACTKDRNYIVDFLSKEACNEKAACLKKGNNVSQDFINNATEWCNSLPSNTTKSFDASVVVDYTVRPTNVTVTTTVRSTNVTVTTTVRSTNVTVTTTVRSTNVTEASSVGVTTTVKLTTVNEASSHRYASAFFAFVLATLMHLYMIGFN